MPRALDGEPAQGPVNLDHCGQILDLSLPHQLVKPADNELLEVRSGAMELARSPVLVLLLDHDRRWVVLHGMRDKTDTARLLARGEG